MNQVHTPFSSSCHCRDITDLKRISCHMQNNIIIKNHCDSIDKSQGMVVPWWLHNEGSIMVTAVAGVQTLAQEFPYATGTAFKKTREIWCVWRGKSQWSMTPRFLAWAAGQIAGSLRDGAGQVGGRGAGVWLTQVDDSTAWSHWPSSNNHTPASPPPPPWGTGRALPL